MTHLTEVGTEPALPWSAEGSRGFVGWVSTSNPFYVLSALLFLIGLWISFGGQVVAAQSWALLAGTVGYTALLAVTACLLVRFVGVWNDVRTLLLLVVLMILATSVLFDEVLARVPSRGIACYLTGLGFAVVVSEAMLRAIRLALPPLFKAPYYLTLALFFLYPVAITPLLDDPLSESLLWSLYGFAPAAGLVALTLIPAARRGRDYVCGNGSPWRWAWYPWTLFGLLALAVPARSALLCWSMHHIPQAAVEPYIFGPYFLAPFVFCVGLVLLEIGLVEWKTAMIAAGLAAPAVALILAAAGHRPEAFYQGFLQHFIARLGGTPLYLALLASTAYYLYAMLRRIPAATEALAVTLAGLTVVAPTSLDLGSLAAPRPWPIVAIALLELVLGARRRDSWRCLVAACCLTTAAAMALPPSAGASRDPVTFHMVVVFALILGAAFDDRLGRLLRNGGPAAATLGAVVVLSGGVDRPESIPTWALEVYPPGVIIVVAAYGYLLGHRASYTLAGLTLCLWLGVAGCRCYVVARQFIVGLDYLALSMLFFALAVLTSVSRGRVPLWRFAVTEPKPAPPSD